MQRMSGRHATLYAILNPRPFAYARRREKKEKVVSVKSLPEENKISVITQTGLESTLGPSRCTFNAMVFASSASCC